jgi:hypothetical protein
MPRRSAPAALVATGAFALFAFACGSFTGEDQSAADASSDAVAPSDANANADGAMASRSDAALDGTAVTSGDADASDAAACMLVFSDAFEDGTFGANWTPTASSGLMSPTVTTAESVGAGHSLTAHIVTDVTTSVYSTASRKTTKLAPKMVLTYSVYVKAWQNFNFVDFGCSFELDSSSTRSYVDFEADNTMPPYSIVGTTGPGPTETPQTVSGALKADIWYDVVLTLTGVSSTSTSDVTALIQIFENGTEAPVGSASTTIGAVPPVMMLGVNCGLTDVQLINAMSTTLDVWIDNVTLSACP